MGILAMENSDGRMRETRRAVGGFILLLLSSVLLLAGTTAASSTSAKDQTDLERAFALDEGSQAPRDAAVVAKAYERAAEGGDPFAHFRLGYFYETGDGVPHDPAEARKHYEMAVASGVMEARLRLAICYLEGWGGPVDRTAFAREVRSAAEAGYAPAQRVLSTIYALGFTVPLNREESVRWLERAAAQDDPGAQVALGQTAEHRRGIALMADKKLARTWYQLSAEQEYTDGMRAMARSFLVGKKSDRDWVLGHRWLELAADSEDSEAPYILAVCEVLHVDAPQRDYERARQWLRDAAARGNHRAKEVLEIEQTGKPLASAMMHVLSVPFEQRYVENVIAKTQAEADQPTRQPVVIHVVKPRYPESLRLTGIKGEATVQFVVDSNGRVVDPKVIKTTHPLFGDRAIEAVLQWRFRPGIREGRSVSTRMVVPLLFELKEGELEGVDGMIGYARSRAQILSPAAAEDAKDLSLGRPVTNSPYPTMPDKSPLPEDSRALVMLVIDANGVPQRGYILEAKPETIGPAVLSSALARHYRPQLIDGQPVTASVLVPFHVDHSGENPNVFRAPQ